MLREGVCAFLPGPRHDRRRCCLLRQERHVSSFSNDDNFASTPHTIPSVPRTAVSKPDDAPAISRSCDAPSAAAMTLIIGDNATKRHGRTNTTGILRWRCARRAAVTGEPFWLCWTKWKAPRQLFTSRKMLTFVMSTATLRARKSLRQWRNRLLTGDAEPAPTSSEPFHFENICGLTITF